MTNETRHGTTADALEHWRREKMTNFEANKKDTHLNNLVRQVRDRLLANNPVQAYICLKDLENYLNGLNMEGKPWK